MSSAAINLWVSQVEDQRDNDSPPSPKRRRIERSPRQPLATMSSNTGRVQQRRSPRKPALSQTPITPSRPRGHQGGRHEDGVAEEETPRAEPILPKAESWAAALEHPLQSRPDLAPSASSVSESSAKTPRSRSPVKNTSDLQFANIEIRSIKHAPPPAIQHLFEDMLSISDMIEVVPKVLEEKASKLSEPLRIRKHSLLDRYSVSDAIAHQELLELHNIVQDAACCEIECEEEAAWNTKVHHAMIKLALRNGSATTTVKHWQITTASIVPELAPKNMIGDTLRSRMVDFALTIEPPSEELRGLVARQPPRLQTVNQTMYSPVCLRPIAVTFETKTETATKTGKNQLAVWTKAWLTRVRQLFPPADFLPPLPLIRAVGHSWFLMFAWEESQGDGMVGSGTDRGDSDVVEDFGNASRLSGKASKHVILGDIEIGNTRSLLGVYQLVKAVRWLALWAEQDFSTWILNAITAPGK